jgi:glycosyltransferase involved in cell wall biosynthesis
MNITFIHAANPYNPAYGGIEVYMKNIIRYIKSNKNINESIIFKYVGTGFNIKEVRSDHNYAKIFSISKKLIPNYKFIFKLFKYRNLIEIKKGDIIHTHRVETMLPFIFSNWSNPKICTIHALKRKVIYFKRGIIQGIIFDILEFIGIYFIDQIITVDINIYDYYKKRYPYIKSKLNVIPNGVDTSIFYRYKKNELDQKRNKFLYKGYEPIILYVGRLEEEKNIYFLLDVFKKVKIIHKNALFLIAGDGVIRTELEQLSKDNKLIDIYLLGKKTEEELVELYNYSDVFVLGSKFEGSPITIREAIACNLPVVTTNVGDIKKYFYKQDGIKIVKEDSQIFSNAIIRLIQDKKQFDFSHLKDLYNIKQSVIKTVNIYKKFN